MTNTELADTLQRDGYLILPEPPALRKALQDAYRAWGRLFATDRKFSLPGSITTPSGFVSMCVPGGCEMKESYYYRDGVRLPAEVDTVTNALVAELLIPVGDVAASIERRCGAGLVREPRRGCLRIMRYPAFHGEKESQLMTMLASEGALRAPVHSDLNSLTILPSPTAPGLEVLGLDGQWRLTDDTNGVSAVYVGQELEQRSEGRFTATLHRVRNPLGPEMHLPRLAMALFIS